MNDLEQNHSIRDRGFKPLYFEVLWDSSGPDYCVGEPYNHCTLSTNYTDEVVGRPSDPYDRGAVGYPISDAYSFEMDQDYHDWHDSAPSCGMKSTYGRRYGDPGWDWQPSACAASTVAGYSTVAVDTTTDQGARLTGARATTASLATTYPTGGAFTDAPIGVTPIKAAHVMELRMRIDVLRLRFGLMRFSWTDPTILAGVTPIKAAHLTDLRTALDEAYAAAVRDAPTYTDGTVLAGVTPIRAIHVMELRGAIRVLEQ